LNIYKLLIEMSKQEKIGDDAKSADVVPALKGNLNAQKKINLKKMNELYFEIGKELSKQQDLLNEKDENEAVGDTNDDEGDEIPDDSPSLNNTSPKVGTTDNAFETIYSSGARWMHRLCGPPNNEEEVSLYESIPCAIALLVLVLSVVLLTMHGSNPRSVVYLPNNLLTAAILNSNDLITVFWNFIISHIRFFNHLLGVSFFVDDHTFVIERLEKLIFERPDGYMRLMDFPRDERESSIGNSVKKLSLHRPSSIKYPEDKSHEVTCDYENKARLVISELPCPFNAVFCFFLSCKFIEIYVPPPIIENDLCLVYLKSPGTYDESLSFYIANTHFDKLYVRKLLGNQEPMSEEKQNQYGVATKVYNIEEECEGGPSSDGPENTTKATRVTRLVVNSPDKRAPSISQPLLPDQVIIGYVDIILPKLEQGLQTDQSTITMYSSSNVSSQITPGLIVMDNFSPFSFKIMYNASDLTLVRNYEVIGPEERIIALADIGKYASNKQYAEIEIPRDLFFSLTRIEEEQETGNPWCH